MEVYVTVKDESIGIKIRLLREYGWKERYVSFIEGQNSRLDELQAAILRVKLNYLDRDNERRNKIASLYNEGLSKTDVLIPKVRNNIEHVFHLYVIRTKKREKLMEFLTKSNINALIHYPLPVHLQPAYKNFVTAPLKITEKIAGEMLSTPNVS